MANDTTKKQREFMIKSMLSAPKQKFQGVGAGFHNDELYYGTSIWNDSYDKTAVITSGRKIYVAWKKNKDEIKSEFGLNYRFEFFSDLLDFDWSNDSIQEFLYGNPPDIGIKKAYQSILEKQKENIWHYENGFHETVSCDILSTYFMPIFASKGRAFFNAEPDSGKTQQLNIYVGLSFHPVQSSNISGASVYRIIESLKPTICTDDFDAIGEEQRTSFIQSLRAYKKGQKAIRADDKRPLGFDLFAHQVVNNVGGLDEITESRCTKHLFMKCPDEFKTSLVENQLAKWQKTRDSLYLTGMQHWQDVKKVYDDLELSEFKKRDFERDAAVLSIANLCGKDVFNKVKNYLLTLNNKRNMIEVQNKWDYNVLKWWKENSHRMPNWFRSRTVAEEIAPDVLTVNQEKPGYEEGLRKISHFIGKSLFSRYPTIETRISGGYTEYHLTVGNLYRIARAKHYDKVLELSPPTTPTTLTTPTPPPTPNTKTRKTQTHKMPLIAKTSQVDGVDGVDGEVKGGKSVLGVLCEKCQKRSNNGKYIDGLWHCSNCLKAGGR